MAYTLSLSLCSPIKDIHDVIDIAVISEKSGKEDKLGQLKIPLLRVNIP